MNKQFHHLGQTWEAVGTGTGHGVGFGFSPEINRWGVIFRSISKPEQGDYRYRGTISKEDPNAIEDAQLKTILEEALVVAAIDRSNYTWRTAEGIAKETKISIERVRAILDSTMEADIIQAAKPNKQRHILYSTRNHFMRTTGDVSRYFKDVEKSS